MKGEELDGKVIDSGFEQYQTTKGSGGKAIEQNKANTKNTS